MEKQGAHHRTNLTHYCITFSGLKKYFKSNSIFILEQLSQLTFFSPMFLAIAINSSARSLLIYLVEEKKGRYKETFKVSKKNYSIILRLWE